MAKKTIKPKPKKKEPAIKKQFPLILGLISEGYSLRKALKEIKVSSSTFFKYLDGGEELEKRYARACTERHEAIFDEIIEISDNGTSDKKIINKNGQEVEVTDYENIQRSKLRVDSRKWQLSKLEPKKYGDKIEVEQKIENLPPTLIPLQFEADEDSPQD